MNPGLIDLPATYAAMLPSPPDAPRLGSSGASQPDFAPACPLWVGRVKSAKKTADTGGGQRVTADETFLARWSPYFAEGGRLTVEGIAYDIVGITAAPGTPRRSWLWLECRHVAGVSTVTRPATAFA